MGCFGVWGLLRVIAVSPEYERNVYGLLRGMGLTTSDTFLRFASGPGISLERIIVGSISLLFGPSKKKAFVLHSLIHNAKEKMGKSCLNRVSKFSVL